MEKFLLVNVPTPVLGLGMVLLAVGLALGGLVFVRGRMEHNRFVPQHEVAGFIIAVVGVIYAVLLAFVVIIQWESFTSAEGDASSEATATGRSHRGSWRRRGYVPPAARAELAIVQGVTHRAACQPIPAGFPGAKHVPAGFRSSGDWPGETRQGVINNVT